jgi:hypothetical protein
VFKEGLLRRNIWRKFSVDACTVKQIQNLGVTAMTKVTKFFTVLPCLLLFALPAPGFAADEDFAAAHGDFFHLMFFEWSDIRAGYLMQPDSKADSGDGKFDLQVFSTDFELPLALSDDFFLRIGAQYEGRQYDFGDDGWTGWNTEKQTLHKAVVTPGLGVFITDDLLLTGRAIAGAYSNFDGGLESDDFKAYGDGLLVYRLNPEAQILAGASYSEAFEDYDVVPLLGFRLLSEDGRLRINLTAPVEIKVGYELIDGVEVFGGCWASGDRYNARVDGENIKIEVRDRRVGGGLSFWLGSHLNLVLEGGVLLESELEFVSERRNVRSTSDKVEPAGYFGGHIGVAL